MSKKIMYVSIGLVLTVVLAYSLAGQAVANPVTPGINIEKTVDCNADGEYLDTDYGYAGDTASWKIVVCNTGLDGVSNTGPDQVYNIHVTDTNGENYTIAVLNPGECHTHIYTTVVNVDTENIATAQGVDEFGNPVGPVSDSATNLVISPALCIEKTVDCNADGEYLDEDTGIAGDTAHWKVVVTNCGDSPVTNIVVTDTNLHDFGSPFDLPNNLDDMEFNYDTTVNETTTNTATAVGEDQLGGIVGPVTDSATNLVIRPDIAIDVKPGSCPNPLNVKGRGVLPVAILGTADFDVTQVDPATVMLEGVAPPLRWALEDVATPYEANADGCWDRGPDGYLDLTLKFDTQVVVAALGDVSDGDVLVLTLTGNLMEEHGGTPIKGEDVIVIIKKR